MDISKWWPVLYKGSNSNKSNKQILTWFWFLFLTTASLEGVAGRGIHSDASCKQTVYLAYLPTTDTKKSASELREEQKILSEIMRTVEKRDTLVSLLEEQRLKERAEDRDLESLVLSKGYEFHWAQKDDG